MDTRTETKVKIAPKAERNRRPRVLREKAFVQKVAELINGEDGANADRQDAKSETGTMLLLDVLSRIDEPYPDFNSVNFGPRWLYDNSVDLSSPSGKARISTEVMKQAVANIEKLMVFYGLNIEDEKSWVHLAFLLAARHVDGFFPAPLMPGPGAPERWTVPREVIFYCWISRRRRLNKKGSIRQFCLALPKGLRAYLPGEGAETLRRHYHKLSAAKKFAEYDAAQIALHGDDWIECAASGELWFDPFGKFTVGIPNMGRTTEA